jgi:hypothetical protein
MKIKKHQGAQRKEEWFEHGSISPVFGESFLFAGNLVPSFVRLPRLGGS